MKRRRNRPLNVVVLSQATTALKACPNCQAEDKPFTYSTNGDGGTAQCCTACGQCFPMGARYYQDQAVGVRLIQFSYWSALHNPRRTET
jgi:transcription elongation factor Elf1